MKHYKIEIVAETTKKVLKETTCDMCGCTITRTRFSAEDIQVRYRKGVSYPEGGWGTETSIDMCSTCFDEKLIPWLKSQDVKPLAKDWDW